MKLTDIYTTLQTNIQTITGQTYVIDRAPQPNFSEGRSGVYRFIRPSSISKTRRTHGAPETIINCEVGIVALKPSSDLIDSAEDELDNLLNTLLRLDELAPNLIIYAAETRPTSEQIVNADGLDSEYKVLEAQATISIRGYYI